MRVLLLNPPGERIYIRDYLCSKTSKASYVYQPIDLVVLSGTMGAEHDVHVLDCIAERLPVARAHARIERIAPDVIVSLVASVSWPEDRAFLASEAARGRRILALGDLLHEKSEDRLAEEPWIEAALHVFANRDACAYLAGEQAAIEDMTVRDVSGSPVRIRPVEPHRRERSFRVPRPRHELFPEQGYRFSFARSTRFATLLTDYGCAWPCTFCVMSTLGFQVRPVPDVLEEIDALRARGVRELFFLDQTFGAIPRRALELCRALEERGDLSWTAFTRPDVASEELVCAMRRAGCHTLILGIESADDALLAEYRKGYDTSEVRAACARAHAAGLRIVGTVILGLPEQDAASLERTLALAIELELDFLSLNVAVPRFGTPFREKILALGLASERDLVMDQGGAEIFLPTATLDRAALRRAKQRLVRRFYLRPGWLVGRLASIRNLAELRVQVREGLALLARNV
jgi:radical SAM superfamily enzyme YgiQ (UPF0313 family)